jgi:hypothetical protein
MFWVKQGEGQVQISPKSDPGSRSGTRVPPTVQNKPTAQNKVRQNVRRSDGRLSAFAPQGGDAGELAQGAVLRLGFRNVRRLIPTANIAASNHAAGLEMSLENTGHIGFTSHDGNPTTISRAPSEATPLDPDRARGWRRGFDAIAKEFM